MVPDKLPPSANEPTRERALRSVRTGLVEATKRLNQFLENTRPEDVIKRVHTAKTEIINDQDEHEIVDYYTLWTEFAELRLIKSGWLLVCDYDGKREDEKAHGYDKSDVLSIYDMRNNPDTYTTPRLSSLAEKLNNFLAR